MYCAKEWVFLKEDSTPWVHFICFLWAGSFPIKRDEALLHSSFFFFCSLSSFFHPEMRLKNSSVWIRVCKGQSRAKRQCWDEPTQGRESCLCAALNFQLNPLKAQRRRKDQKTNRWERKKSKSHGASCTSSLVVSNFTSPWTLVKVCHHSRHERPTMSFDGRNRIGFDCGKWTVCN